VTEEVALILVEAGATYASAARAAVLLEAGASIAAVRPTLQMRPEPRATFDSQLLTAELDRVKEFVAVLRG
jgi:hypothetical protein